MRVAIEGSAQSLMPSVKRLLGLPCLLVPLMYEGSRYTGCPASQHDHSIATSFCMLDERRPVVSTSERTDGLEWRAVQRFYTVNHKNTSKYFCRIF